MTTTGSPFRFRTVMVALTAPTLLLSGCSALPGFLEGEGSLPAPGSSGASSPGASSPGANSSGAGSTTPATPGKAAPAQDCAAILPILGTLPPLTLDANATDYFTEYADSVSRALDASTNGEITAALTGISAQLTRASDLSNKLAALSDTSGLNPAQLLERTQQAAALTAEAPAIFADLSTQVGTLTNLCPQVK